MRSPQEPKPTPWLNRRDQRRMMRFMCLLMLVILAIDMTRKPENWNWFFALSQSPDETDLNPLGDIDFQIKEKKPALPLESFVALPESSKPVIPQNSNSPDIHQVPQEFLQGVEDQRVGHLRSDEIPLQKMLEQVKDFSQAELLKSGRTDVGFRVVNVDPESHRGELLYLDGKLWRLAPYATGDPDSTADDLVQAWIFTEDSGNNPWVVLLAEKPAGLEFGNGIDRRVKVAGYFFKRFGYPTEEGMHVAPMLVGKTLTLPPTLAVEQKETMEVTYYVVGILSAIACLFAVVIGSFYLSDRKYQRSQAAKIAEHRLDPSPETVSDLNKLPADDPAETFRKLQEHDM